MGTKYWKWMLIATVGIAVGLWALPCRGGEVVKEEKVWLEDEPAPGPGHTPGGGGPVMEGPRWDEGAMIDRMMMQIREKDPKRADELERLRKDNPEAFRGEMQRMREEFGQQMQERMREHRMQMPSERRGMPNEGPPEMIRERIHDKHEEYLQWLDQNYPQEAAELVKVKDENPQAYMRRLGLSLRKYGRMFEASKEHPELLPVMKEDLVLKEKRDELLRKIKGTAEEAQKQVIVKELEQVVSQRFDLIVKRKQIGYQDLEKKLEELRKEVELKKAEVEKWKSPEFKQQSVKEHLNELVSHTEKFEWD